MSTITSKEAIRIEWKDGNRPVFVSPKDEDRFYTTSQEAAEALRHRDKIAQFQKEIMAILKHLREWMRSHASDVDKCYFGFRSGRQVIFVVPRSAKFDFKLSDELTQLDIELAEKFHLSRCEIMQVPGYSAETLSTFIDPSEAILIYGFSA
jgi:hypothetical protein